MAWPRHGLLHKGNLAYVEYDRILLPNDGAIQFWNNTFLVHFLGSSSHWVFITHLNMGQSLRTRWRYNRGLQNSSNAFEHNWNDHEFHDYLGVLDIYYSIFRIIRRRLELTCLDIFLSRQHFDPHFAIIIYGNQYVFVVRYDRISRVIKQIKMPIRSIKRSDI